MMAVVRKRDRYTRARAKRSRPRTPAPSTGWRIRELADMTQISTRTLRTYVAAGLLTAIEFRGTATRYPRRELLRLLALMRMRRETKLHLAEIRRKLDAVSESELEAWLRTSPLPPAARAALGIVEEPKASSAPEAAPDSGLERWKSQLETFQRIQLLPGLELLVHSNPSPAAQHAAHKICSEYLG